MLDVSDRKAAEQALRASEEHFRRMIENASDLILISAPDGTLTYASPSARRLLGRDPATLVGLGPEALVHPDDLPEIQAAMRVMTQAPGTVVEATFRMRRADGEWRLLEAVGRTLAPDTPDEGVVAHGRDITERRAAEEALQRSEEHFRRLIENASDLVMIARPDGQLTYASPSVERLLGYRPEQLVGLLPGDLIHPDDVAAVWAVLGRIAAEPGTVHAFGARLRHRDGSWRTVEALGRTVAPDSADEGIVANSRDVTARLEAEAALRQAKADAEHARRRGGAGEPGEERVPQPHEPRAAHAAQQHPRLRAGARGPGDAARVPHRRALHPQRRRAPAQPHQRGARHRAHRGRPAADVARAGERAGGRARGRRHGAPARPRRAASRSWRRRAPWPTGTCAPTASGSRRCSSTSCPTP
jgi:PAS domain S-box-containing protein